MCFIRGMKRVFSNRIKIGGRKMVVISVLAVPKQSATAQDSGALSPTLVDTD